MKMPAIILSYLLMTGCVSGDCERDCYAFEIRRVDRLALKCETSPFHPHCEHLHRQ
jgi:hypothetical protein